MSNELTNAEVIQALQPMLEGIDNAMTLLTAAIKQAREENEALELRVAALERAHPKLGLTNQFGIEGSEVPPVDATFKPFELK